MKKVLLILAIVFITGCNLINDGCQSCIGGSDDYYSRLSYRLSQKMISYEQYASAVQKAKTCNTVVCNTDRCAVHK